MNCRIIAVVLILVVTLPLLYIAANHLNKRYERTRAATNLKALGKAKTVYAGGDYDAEYTVYGSAADANSTGDLTLLNEPNDF